MDEFLVRGAYVLTMDPELGDLPSGEVHVRAGAIVAVGTGLGADCPVPDGTGTVVMPGLVDGRILVRGGHPTEIDPAEVVRATTAALPGLLNR